MTCQRVGLIPTHWIASKSISKHILQKSTEIAVSHHAVISVLDKSIERKSIPKLILLLNPFSLSWLPEWLVISKFHHHSLSYNHSPSSHYVQPLSLPQYCVSLVVANVTCISYSRVHSYFYSIVYNNATNQLTLSKYS